jgi:urease accessory protein
LNVTNQSLNQLPDYPITRLPDSRRPSTVGREAHLELAFERRRGRTVLTHSYAEPPLRVGRVFDVDGAAYLILVCTGPGIFAGDSLQQSVSVGPGARVLIASQSALQIHPGDAVEAATLRADYRVEEDGELHCHWDPVIPFTGARLSQRVSIQLGETGRFYWSDGLMSGRASRGEAWQFQSVDQELRLEIGGRASYLERYRLDPSERFVHHPWRAGLADYVGTVLVHHEAASPAFAEALQRRLDSEEEVVAGIDVIEPALLVGRLLGTSGVRWSCARRLCRDLALASVFQTPSLVVRR